MADRNWRYCAKASWGNKYWWMEFGSYKMNILLQMWSSWVRFELEKTVKDLCSVSLENCNLQYSFLANCKTLNSTRITHWELVFLLWNVALEYFLHQSQTQDFSTFTFYFLLPCVFEIGYNRNHSISWCTTGLPTIRWTVRPFGILKILHYLFEVGFTSPTN